MDVDHGSPAPPAAVRVRAGGASGVLAVAVLAWLVFTVVHLALNGRWWVWLFASAVPPLLFVAVPAIALIAAAFVRPVRRRVVAAAALAMVLGLPYGGLNWSALRPGDRSVPAGALRVFSWNTEYWDQQDDPDAFYRFLKEQNADVYLLQEYLGWDLSRPYDGELPIDDLARLRREFPGYQVAARSELLTLSRLPIVGQSPVAPDPAAFGDRGADFHRVFRYAKVLRTDVRVGPSIVSFYNTHIAVQLKIASPLSRDFWSFPRRADKQRAAQLRGLREDIAANPRQVVVAGDFNTSPAMADLDDLSGLLHDPIGANTALYPATWTPGPLPPLWRLDWAFVSKGVTVHSYDFRSPRSMSDHDAQELTLSFAMK